MSLKKKIVLACLVVLVLLLNFFILTHDGGVGGTAVLTFSLNGTASDNIQVFYSDTADFDPSNQHTCGYETEDIGKDVTMEFALPLTTRYVRIDFGAAEAEYRIRGARFVSGDREQLFDSSQVQSDNDIASYESNQDAFSVSTEKGDPFIIYEQGPDQILADALPGIRTKNTVKNVIIAVLLDLMCVVAVLFRKKFSTLPMELIQNRVLIMQLARNDFKTKYAGSVFGIVWAFIQPAITIVVYWFVFQVGLGAADVTAPTGITYPFVLWLICGLVPWFFFQDTLVGGTNALLEYTYLVKKVVFKISILPIVKEISALFVHLFFIFLMLVLFTLSGHFPDLHSLQVFYYSFCLFMYSLGVCYATCSIVVFFRDLSQIISIIIQIQVWMTPIMWNIDNMSARMPGWLITVFKLNPIFYIVNGYRDSMMNKVWFWERFDLTFYFWAVTAVFFVVGAFIFKRLKIHFADTL
jgi:teichoic acid transport system permease protein